MARNKFLKRMAVTALAASMTFGTVPAVAMNVFAAGTVTAARPTNDNEAGTLYDDFATAVNGLSGISTKSTGNDIATKIKTALESHTPSNAYDVEVTIDSAETAKYDTDTSAPVAPVIKAHATVKKYVKATQGDQEHATDAIAVLTNYEFTVNCDVLTDEDHVAVAMGYYKATLDSEYAKKNGYTFADEESVSATPIKAKLADLKRNLSVELARYIDNGISIGDITTNIESHSTPDMEGYVAITVPVTHNTEANEAAGTKASSYSGTFDAKVRISWTEEKSTLADAQKVIDNAELTNEEAVSGYTYSKDSESITANNFADIKQILNGKLSAAGIKGIEVASVAIANDSSNKTATHAANGSVKVSVTYNDNDNTTSIQTLTIVHSEADIEAEAVAQVSSALSALTATDFQKANATAAPSTEDVKKVITDAVDKALNNKLGGTATIASELYSENPYEFAATPRFDYIAATANSNGSVTAAIQLNKAHAATSKVDTKKYEDFATILIGTEDSGTISLSALKQKDATAFSLGSDIVAKGSSTIVPTLTPDDANTAYVKLEWKGNSKLDKVIVRVNDSTIGEIDRTGTTTGVAEGSIDKVTIRKGDTIQIINGTDTTDYDPDNSETWKNAEGTLTATLYDARDNKLGTDSINVNLTELFNDVTDATQYYFAPVYKLANLGVISGTTASTYSPAQDVKRADFISLLYRAANDNNTYSKNNFTDVSSDAYYAKAVDWAVANKIAYGTSSTTFNPNKTVTRAEAVAFLARYNNKYGYRRVDVTKGDTYASTIFTDVNPEDYFAEAVTWAYNRGITYGKTPTTFAPTANVTRAQAAAFISRLLNLTGTNGYNHHR